MKMFQFGIRIEKTTDGGYSLFALAPNMFHYGDPVWEGKLWWPADLQSWIDLNWWEYQELKRQERVVYA